MNNSDTATVRVAIAKLEQWVNNLTRYAERCSKLAEEAPSYAGNGLSLRYWRNEERAARKAANCYAAARDLLTQGDETS